MFDIVIVNDDLDESYEKLQSVLKEVSLKRRWLYKDKIQEVLTRYRRY